MQKLHGIPQFIFRFWLFTKRYASLFILCVTVIIFCIASLNLFYPVKTALSFSTIVTDNQGNVIHAYLSKDEKWRMKTELSEISVNLKKALIYKEDRYFYMHFGINPLAMIRAALTNVFRNKRVSGASTITMQTIRLLEPRKRNYASKVIEIVRAMQLEMQLSKEEILQLYLNLLPYGGNIEGVKSAAVLYLKKNPLQLSVAEIAALSIIPNKPTSLRPETGLGNILAERDKWLLRWKKSGLFSKEVIDDALSEPFLARRRPAPSYIPHLSQKLQSEFPGKVIPTYIDMNLQLKCEKIVKDYVRNIKWHDIHNAAVIVLNNENNQVLAYLGSADFNDRTDGGQVNGANALRQPGSALKPLLYALGIDQGLFCPQTVINDVPVNFKGYQPENYDQHFNGPVTISYALENSLNIPAVKILNELGKEHLISKLIACNFNKIKQDKDKLGLSLILGGCGVTLEEMTALYAAQANMGCYRRSKFTSLDIDTNSTTLYSKAAAFMITEMLVKITRPDLPVGYENSSHLPKIAWKTGTSYGRRDAWSIGYNKKFTVGVWVGNFSNRGVPELSGATIATPLLFQLFNTLDYNSNQSWYSMPEGCQIRWVCSKSGQIPDHFCNEQRLDYHIPLISPSAICTHKREVILSADEKFAYCRNCEPQEGIVKKWFDVVDPELIAWYEQHSKAYEKVPPHNPFCDRLFTEGAPLITFPNHEAEYLISMQNPEPLQLTCQAAADVKNVYWYINHKFYRKVAALEKVFFNPEMGESLISCTDDKGRNSSIKIKVRRVDL